MFDQKALYLLGGHGRGHSVPAEHFADLRLRGVVQLGKAGVFGVHLGVGHGDLLCFGNGPHRKDAAHLALRIPAEGGTHPSGVVWPALQYSSMVILLRRSRSRRAFMSRSAF